MPTTSSNAAGIASLADALGAGGISRTGWWIISAAIALLLLPTLFYPIGPDQGMFLLGGEKILRGAIHYRDIVDVKPPLIYYIYAGIAALFGTAEISIRIFDLLLQTATVLVIVRLVRRATGNDRWAAGAGICYALLYLMQEYQSTAQVESFVGLLGLGMLFLLLYARNGWSYLAVGILSALLFLLKFTLGIMLVVALAGELVIFGERLRTALRNGGIMIAGFLIVAGGFLLWLSASDALHGFLLMQQFTTGYVRTQVPSLGGWLKNLFETLPLHASDFYSFLLLALTIVGIARTLPLRSSEGLPLDRPDAIRLARLCVLAFLLLMATLTIEGKYYSYHFIRLYPFGAILVPLGAMPLLRGMARRPLMRGYGHFTTAGLAAIALLLSPLPRAAWHLAPMALRLTKGMAGVDGYYATDDGESRAELKQVGATVRRNLGPGEHLFAVAATGSLVYYFSGEVPDFKIFHSAFIVAPFAPQEWRDSTRAYVLAARPRVIALQLHDNRSDQTGVMTSSHDAFLALPGIPALLAGNYTLILRTGSYEVYLRH